MKILCCRTRSYNPKQKPPSVQVLKVESWTRHIWYWYNMCTLMLDRQKKSESKIYHWLPVHTSVYRTFGIIRRYFFFSTLTNFLRALYASVPYLRLFLYFFKKLGEAPYRKKCLIVPKVRYNFCPKLSHKWCFLPLLCSSLFSVRDAVFTFFRGTSHKEITSTLIIVISFQFKFVSSLIPLSLFVSLLNI